MNINRRQPEIEVAAQRRRLKLTNLAVYIISFGLLIYGYRADFISWRTWSLVGFFVAVLATCFAAALAVFSYRSGLLRFKRPQTRKVIFFRFSVLIPLGVFWFWIAIVHGLGALTTNIQGEPFIEIKAEVSKERGTSTRRGPECGYQLISPQLDGAFPAHFCISERRYKTLDDATEVYFGGFRSSLGFSIRYIRFDGERN